MGTYNTLRASLVCTRCKGTADMVIDVYAGLRDLKEYRVGDRYDWVPRKSPKNGGRPPNGSVDAEGYTECPACHKDFYVTVQIRRDVIEGVEPDPIKKPHLPN